MEKNVLIVTICTLILVAPLVTGTFGTSYHENELLEDKPMELEEVDVPTWSIGDSWTYEHYIWQNMTGSDDYTYLEGEMTYTVSEIDNFDYRGETYFAYNMTITGEITDGSAEQDGYTVSDIDGTIDGWQLNRVSDLAFIANNQEIDVNGTTMGFINVWMYIDQTRSYSPAYEEYDFPLSLGDDFWANSTTDIDIFYEYDAGPGGSGSNDLYEEVDYIQEVGVSDSLETVTMPGGTFDTYYVENYMNNTDGTDEGKGYIKNWYDEDVGYFVHQRANITNFIDRDTYWIYRYIDHERAVNQNTLSIDPSTAKVGQEVTISGQFPEYPDEPITISIPRGADPVSEWTTTTDENGDYSFDIEVPYAEDDAETLDYFSSVGLVATLDSDPTGEMIVTTLVILEPDEPVIQEVPLSTGWNFVSTNLIPTHETIDEIINDEEYGIPDSYTKMMYYDAPEDRWFSYVPDRAEHFNSIETWCRTFGFWIYLSESATLFIQGHEPESTDITLYPGWNMVGMPSSTGGNHGLPAEVTKIGYFDALEDYNIAYDYSPGSFEFEVDQGYWIYNSASESVIWNVDY